MRPILFALLCLTTARPAAAQVFEFGGGAGRGCVGDSSGFCGDEAGPMWSLHAGLWLDDRLELGGRVATLPLPHVTYTVFRDDRFNRVADPAISRLPTIDVMLTERSRRLLSGELIYHFRRGSRVRPMLGLGMGSRTERWSAACVQPGCEQLLPIVATPAGRGEGRAGLGTIIAGVSGRPGRRILVRGGVRLHNFAGEQTSTTEVFAAVGYQIGR